MVEQCRKKVVHILFCAMLTSHSLPSNICQIQATLFGNTTTPPIDSRTVRPKTRWRKGWRRPFWAVFAPFCTVFAPFRTIFAPFRIVLNRFRTVSSAERCEKFAKTCENFAKIPRKFANRLLHWKKKLKPKIMTPRAKDRRVRPWKASTVQQKRAQSTKDIMSPFST